MNQDDINLVKPQTGWQLANYQKLVKVGLDLFKGKTEWMPQLFGSFGGLVADMEGRTKVPGLFAAGRGRSIDPGVYIGGFALFTTAVTGYMTGPAAAEYAKSNDLYKIDVNEVSEIKKSLYSPLGKRGIPPKEILREIQEIMYPYNVCILKNEKSLTNAFNNIEKLKADFLPLMTAQTPHYLLKLKEIEAIAFLSELYLKSSLKRTESRAGHYREDYPDRDDKKWLKWIILYQDEGKLKTRAEPVPFDKYKFKPTRYYMDNFRFPKHPTQ
jgi:succinate dehydrogenase/fumarate reductase flavoprotein subunit